MSNKVYGIIIAVMFLVGIDLIYKTFQLRESVLSLGLSIAELDLSTKEFSCDIEKFEAYELGHKQGLEDAGND